MRAIKARPAPAIHTWGKRNGGAVDDGLTGWRLGVQVDGDRGVGQRLVELDDNVPARRDAGTPSAGVTAIASRPTWSPPDEQQDQERSAGRNAQRTVRSKRLRRRHRARDMAQKGWIAGSRIEIGLIGHGNGRHALGQTEWQGRAVKDAGCRCPSRAPRHQAQRGAIRPAHDHGDHVGVGHAATDDEAAGTWANWLSSSRSSIDEADDVNRFAGKGFRCA